MKNIKKILALVLVVVSVLALSVPAFASTPKWVTANPNLNFRDAPGGSLIDRIPIRCRVTEYSTSTVNGVVWSYITWDGIDGYVQTSFLTTVNPGYIHPIDKGMAFGYSTLNQGDNGYRVKNLQLALNRGGFNAGTVDGAFGNQTYQAVRAYQSAKGLTVDGLVGDGTKTQLWADYGSYLLLNGVMP